MVGPNGTMVGAPAFGPGPPAATAVTPLRHPLPLKLFFLLVSISLITSSLTGIYMTFLYKRDAGVIIGLLAAGIVVPIVLLFI